MRGSGEAREQSGAIWMACAISPNLLGMASL